MEEQLKKENYSPPQKNKKPRKQKKKKSTEKKISKLKLTFIILVSILTALCLAVDIWALWIYFFAPQKIVSKTYMVDFQTTEDGDKEPFVELKYFSNANKNGYEALDLKFNFMLDENQSSLYSQGIQYVAQNSEQSNSLNFNFYADTSTRDKEPYDTTTSWGNTKRYYNGFGTWLVNSNFDKFEYQSFDNYETTSNSTNPIDLNASFKIELGEGNLYMLKFRAFNDYVDTKVSAEKREQYLTKSFVQTREENVDWNVFSSSTDIVSYHYMYDVNYLTKLLFDSLEPIKKGSSQVLVYDLPDVFDYFKYVDGQYSDEREIDSLKLEQQVKNYYTIKVTVLDDGIQKSDESLFNCVKGSASFNLTNDYSSNEFYVGRSVIHATFENFDLVERDDGTFDIVLNSEFLNKYEKYKSKIYLNLILDYKPYENKGLIVNEPTYDSVKGFSVYKIDINKSYYSKEVA